MSQDEPDCVNPYHYALVVGINEYPWIGNLTKPLKDAADFCEWLLDPRFGGLTERNCRTVFAAPPPPRGPGACGVRLTSTENEEPDLPNSERNLVVVARANKRLYFRILDVDGSVIVNTDEMWMTERKQQIEDLKKLTANWWPPYQLTDRDKVAIINAVASVVDEHWRPHVRPKIIDVKQKLHELMKAGDELFDDDAELWTSSRLYIFFAGHGMGERFQDSDLFMADAGLNYYELRVSCQYILEHLTEIRPSFKEVVIFADCCRSRKKDIRAAFILDGKEWPRRGTISYARCYGTLFGEESLETTSDDGRGFFSQALLEGLRGLANPSGLPITTENLGAYVRKRLEILTKNAAGKAQFPDIYAPKPFVLLKQTSGIALRPIYITFRTFTGKVQLHGPDDQPVSEIPPFDASPNAVWHLPPLPRAIYRVVAITGDQALLAANGFFSWKDIPEENGVLKPKEM